MLEKILTNDNLRRHGMIVVSWCYMFKAVREFLALSFPSLPLCSDVMRYGLGVV